MFKKMLMITVLSLSGLCILASDRNPVKKQHITVYKNDSSYDNNNEFIINRYNVVPAVCCCCMGTCCSIINCCDPFLNELDRKKWIDPAINGWNKVVPCEKMKLLRKTAVETEKMQR